MCLRNQPIPLCLKLNKMNYEDCAMLRARRSITTLSRSSELVLNTGLLSLSSASVSLFKWNIAKESAAVLCCTGLWFLFYYKDMWRNNYHKQLLVSGRHPAALKNWRLCIFRKKKKRLYWWYRRKFCFRVCVLWLVVVKIKLQRKGITRKFHIVWCFAIWE